ncbi:MAG TPA: hypothetical protein VK277_15520 [Acidimicrobiales bacterium]|nr:hypothetical protein [Acidimicrobiales bacterium]
MSSRALRLAAGAAVAVGSVLVAALPASAGFGNGKIGPHQFFIGLVNGQSSDAVVQVVCPGPEGLTGRALGGQTFTVLSPTAIPNPAGYTGTAAHGIVAYFAPVPASAKGTVRFTHYGVTKTIPTNIPLPCSGAGLVTFAPEPSSPTAVSYNVAVTFVNVAV